MHRKLYALARKINRAATFLNDAKTLASGDPKKIAKRALRKQAYKSSHGGAGKIARGISKFLK